MKNIVKNTLAAIGILAIGALIGRFLKYVFGGSLLFIIGALIAIKMILTPYVRTIETDHYFQLQRLEAVRMEKENERVQQLKLKEIEFQQKLMLKEDIDVAIKKSTDTKELLEYQISAEKEQLNKEVKALKDRIEVLKASERARLEALPKQIINIETISGTITNVYWMGNGNMGVQWKTASDKRTAAGSIPYANLTQSSIRLLGLSEDIDARINNEALLRERNDPQKVYQNQLAQQQSAHAEWLNTPDGHYWEQTQKIRREQLMARRYGLRR